MQPSYTLETKTLRDLAHGYQGIFGFGSSNVIDMPSAFGKSAAPPTAPSIFVASNEDTYYEPNAV